MNIFSFVYTEILFRPLFNLLVGFTTILPSHSLGLATILVTLVVRLILLPPAISQAKHSSSQQEKMKGVQKDLQKIKKEHKDDKAKQSQETMKLYKEAGINPAGGCLPLLIQLPILIALYRVFFTGVNPDTFHNLYSFVAAPDSVNSIFFGIELGTPSLVFGVLAGIGQFWLMRMSTRAQAVQPGANDETAQMMASMQKNMQYFFPVMTIFIALRLPAALSLYWVVSTLFAIGQQYALRKWLKTEGSLPAV